MKHFILLTYFLTAIVINSIAADFDVSVYTDGTGAGTLRKAISDANASTDASSTITFSGTQTDITLGTALPNPTKNLTFNSLGGLAVTIKGGNFASLTFGTASKTYTFYNIIFDGGNVTGTSALKVNLAVTGVTINLNNCQVINNKGGGAFRAPIYQQNGTLNCTGCTMTGNSNTTTAGSVISTSSIPGAIAISLTSCTFSGNTGGPVVYAPIYSTTLASVPTVSIDRSIFDNNTNTDRTVTGGIHVGNLTISNSSFTNNKCYNGAIVIPTGNITNKSKLVMTNSTVSGNISCSVLSPYTYQNGGGITIKGAASVVDNCSITNCTISGNTGLAGGGAGVCINEGAYTALSHTVTLNNCTITGNSTGNISTSTGGGLYSPAYGTTILNYCIVAGNNPSSTNNARDINIPTANLGSATGRNLVGAGTVAFGAAGAVTAENQTLAQATNINTILNTLVDNGGSNILPDGSHTKTHALVTSTIAVNPVAASAELQTKDQRGFDRDATPDMGAYELSSTTEIERTTKSNTLVRVYSTKSNTIIDLSELEGSQLIEIFNVNGSKVASVLLNGNTIHLLPMKLPIGFYVIKTNGVNQCQKIIL
jgi:hypothetical protein